MCERTLAQNLAERRRLVAQRREVSAHADALTDELRRYHGPDYFPPTDELRQAFQRLGEIQTALCVLHDEYLRLQGAPLPLICYLVPWSND